MDRTARTIAKEKLPILDLARDPGELAKALNAACEDVGFFYVANHGVPDEISDAVSDYPRAFMQSRSRRKKSSRSMRSTVVTSVRRAIG